jgi:dTDP-4-amino-4,6-dideoxygalactose transaminase
MSLHGLSQDAWRRYDGVRARDYEVVTAGFKYNMADIQAALGIHQLARVDQMLARRAAIWRTYDEAFAPLPLVRPPWPEAGTRHARHLYNVLVDDRQCGRSRDRVADDLAHRGVATAIHFRALHLQPYYADRFGLKRGMFPNAEFISDRTLSLPLSASMSDDEVARVVDAVTGVFR